MSRADWITPTSHIPIYYSDFSINLDLNPVTGQLRRLTNDEAIKQSMLNLVLTNISERPYQPWAGSRIRQSLFENMDSPLTINDMQTSIRDCIEKNEPRATILSLSVTPDYDHNAYSVDLNFSINNITQIFSIQFLISRVR